MGVFVEMHGTVHLWHLHFPVCLSDFYILKINSRCLCLMCDFSPFLLCCCSAPRSCLTLCNPMDCNTPPGFPVPHHLLEFAPVHVHWIRDAIQPSHPLLPSSLALNLSQHQGLFEWVSSSHQVAKVLELQLQHQSFFAICQYQQTANI